MSSTTMCLVGGSLYHVEEEQLKASYTGGE
jgi:hypothetical protein